MPAPEPHVYARTLRTLLRYAIAMAIFGILIGIAYQESAQKLSYTAAPGALHLAAVLPLALVHGHVFTLGVLLPLALAGALVLGLKAGGRPVGPRALAWLKWGFLPFAAATVALQLFKGYFVLLAVRHGQQDLAAVDASFLAGSHTLRYALYAVVHSGMGITLGVFLVALWRSLAVVTNRKTSG
jgi:hypothetical protein